jgi:hypothetical protein
MTVAPLTVAPPPTALDALNRLLDISMGFAVSQTFFAACQFGLFDAVGSEPLTTEQLAERIAIHPRGCRRLHAAIDHLGIVERAGDHYQNSALGAFCTIQSPVSHEPLSMWGSLFYHMWEFLPAPAARGRPTLAADARHQRPGGLRHALRGFRPAAAFHRVAHCSAPRRSDPASPWRRVRRYGGLRGSGATRGTDRAA